MDGTVSLNVYELKLAPIEHENFVTREEFEAFVNSLRAPVPIVESEPVPAPAPAKV